MQRLVGVPTGANPQPTAPIINIRPLAPIAPAAAIPRPVINQPRLAPLAPLAPLASVTPLGAGVNVAVPVQPRPVMTPILAGGRTPIPVQAPRIQPLAPIAPIARGQPVVPQAVNVLPPLSTPVMPVVRAPTPVQRPVLTPPTLIAPRSPIPRPQLTAVQPPAARSPSAVPIVIARPPLAPVTPVRPPLAPVTPVRPPLAPVTPVRPPLAPVTPVRPAMAPISPVTPVRPAMAPLSTLTVRVPAVVNGQVLPGPYRQTINIPIPEPITERPLGEWQLEWFARVREILAHHYGYIDTSQPGAGKTSLALWIAKLFNLPLLVIAPAGIVDAGVWPREAQRTNAQHLLIDVVTYSTLAGKKFKQPSHPYLTSLDRMTEGGVVQTRFDATDYYRSITSRGCLLVFDEFSNLKNTSRKLKASLEMLANVIVEGGASRYALLSGTPFDKEGNAVNILRALRYIRAPRLYHKDAVTKEVRLEGLQELIEACRLMDAALTQRVVAQYDIQAMGTEMSQSLVYELYITVIKKTISGSMPAPPTEGRFEQYNGFFNVNPNDLQRLRQGINELATAVRYDPRTGQIGVAKGAFGRVTPALRIIEDAKIRDMIRVSRSYLEQRPTMKIIIAVSYTESVDKLMAALADFNPIQFDGRTKKKQRAIIEDTFRDSPYHRALIGNITVIGKGLSFQPYKAGEERLTLISPSYHMLDISQVAYRTERAGKKGDSYVYIFYGKGRDIELETNILDAMVRKSGVVKGTLDENGKQLKLPGEYQSYYEAE